MATEKEIREDVTDFWESWHGRGKNAREYDCSEGHMRRKCDAYRERKSSVDKRVAEHDEIRNKYKRRET